MMERIFLPPAQPRLRVTVTMTIETQDGVHLAAKEETCCGTDADTAMHAADTTFARVQARVAEPLRSLLRAPEPQEVLCAQF